MKRKKISLQQAWVLTVPSKAASVVGLKITPISLTGLGHRAQHLHFTLDLLWITQQAQVSDCFERICFIHGSVLYHFS